MRLTRSTLQGLWIALLCGVLIIFLNKQSERGLLQFEKAAVKQLSKSFSPLLEKAREKKDDLAIAELLGALSQAPGVSKANLVPDGESYRLTFTFSDHTRRKIARRLLLIYAITFGALGTGLWLYGVRGRQHLARLEEKLAATQRRLEREQRAREAADFSMRDADAHARQILQDVIRTFDKPIVILDGRQRIAAMSGSAERMGAALNKSWLEVPLLQNKGKEIEEAVKSTSHRWVQIAVE